MKTNLWAILIVMAAIVLPPQESAALPLVLGDAVATCGGRAPADFVLGIIKVQGASGAPLNVNWPAPMFHHPSWTMSRMGQIFGLALDKKGDIYVTATSLYNLDAWGPGGPGAVYQVSGTTGLVTTFATLPQSAASPGLGNICYDPDHSPSLTSNGQFFVTNFEDGKIYRINGTSGGIESTYDPFAPDGGTAGWAPRGERLFGIGYYNGRVYFSVWREDCAMPSGLVSNEIRSIGLTAAGEFAGPDVFEFALPPLKGQVHSNPVSDIEFTRTAVVPRMLLGERTINGDGSSNAHGARMLEYTRTVGWTLSISTFSLGVAAVSSCPSQNGVDTVFSNSSGGVDYGYTTYDSVNRKTLGCDSTAWGSGDALHFAIGDFIYGLQRLPSTGGKIANSVLIDLDGDIISSDKTWIGDVDIWMNCAVTSPCSQISRTLTRDLTPGPSTCCWDLTITNSYSATFWTSIQAQVLTPGVVFSTTGAPAGWTVVQTPFIATWRPDAGTIPLGSSGPLKFCLATGSTTTQRVQLTWFGPNGVRCLDTLVINCDSNSTVPPCANLTSLAVKCHEIRSGSPVYLMSFAIRNNSTFSINNAKITVTSPAMGVTVSPDAFTFAPVSPGFLTPILYDTIFGGNGGDTICFSIQVHDSGQKNCCTFDTCIVLPKCKDCCDSLHIKFANTKLSYRFDGSVTFFGQVTAAPPLLRSFTATIVSATQRIVCPLSPPGPVMQVGGIFTSGSFITVPPLPPPTFGTGEVTWGVNPSGSSVVAAPLTLVMQFPPPPRFQCHDTLRFCIKYSYTDTNCRTCDTTVCYTLVRYGLIIRPGDRFPTDRIPFEPREDVRDDDEGEAKENDPAILSGGEELLDNPVKITMMSSTSGTLTLSNPKVLIGSDPNAEISIVGMTIEPAVGVELRTFSDAITGVQAPVVDRVAKATVPTALTSGNSRGFALTYTNSLNALAWPNYIKLRYVIKANTTDTAEMALVAYARTPGGLGGDKLAVDAGVSLTNVRTYALYFSNYNTTRDSICRVVVSVSAADNDGIIAVGPGLDTLEAGLRSYRTTGGKPILIMEAPSETSALSAPIVRGDTVTPIFVTVCGGADDNVTFSYKTYNAVGEVISSGSFTATDPLVPGPAGIDDPARAQAISLIECYPNPATDQTIFRFVLPRYETVWLTIADLNGSPVGHPVNGVAMMPGMQEVTFDASGLASGSYLYTLRTGTFSQTRRMQIIR